MATNKKNKQTNESHGQATMITQQPVRPAAPQPVECLGLTFANDEARREHFLKILAEKLKDPEFRKTPGFPKGEDEDILRLSDPPYYTACPNPFLKDFVAKYGKPYDPAEPYHRDPFAVDVSVGKTDALYRAHSYHTKVPHLAIVPSILHYTEPGDTVLDGFCGSGMTGVAAQYCGTAPEAYRKQLEQEWKEQGLEAPEWGARQVILNDLSPAATFIAAGYNLPFDIEIFAKEARRILNEVETELGWMYETLHTDGKTKGKINYTVWSEVFTCPECSKEVVFLEEGLDKTTKKTNDEFPCPHCNVTLNKKTLDRFLISSYDRAIGKDIKTPKRVPILINYEVNGKVFEKKPDSADFDIIQKIEKIDFPINIPIDRMMHVSELIDRWGDKWRSGTASFSHVHHLFLFRTSLMLSLFLLKVKAIEDKRLRNVIMFFMEQILWTSSILNRYRPSSSFGNGPMKGLYYVPSQIAETSIFVLATGALKRVCRGFLDFKLNSFSSFVTTGDCSKIPLPDLSVDYVFTDPPFGSNFAYAELNFINESWHRVFTETEKEAIVSNFQKKRNQEYQELTKLCFLEYSRVLKPGRWITIVFSNSSNSIWRILQEAIGTAGFVIADVRTLDKLQGSFNQVHGVTVDQDLVISAYKPTRSLDQQFTLGDSTSEGAWAFIREHLTNAPRFVENKNKVEIVAERTAQMLLDRMTAFHVQRGLAVPLSSAEFLTGLTQRFPMRDGMYFLPEQVAEYDKKRAKIVEIEQFEIFVTGESSAVMWLRQQLNQKPQTYQELQPLYMREAQQAWSKNEKLLELKELLEQNFICFDKKAEPVPSQIHSYLSSNFKELRNKTKEDPELVAKALNRWYVADPSKQADLDKIRDRALLKEFEEYKTTKAKLKQFRIEALRAGFKACYDAKDYKTILAVAAKIPEVILQEDEKLLMYYDVAEMRAGD